MFSKIKLDKLRILSQLLFLVIFIMFVRNQILQKWIIIFAGGVLISIIFGRFYCGWICPIGTLIRFQGWIYKKLGLKRIEVPDIIKTGWFRWLWLIIFVGIMVINRRTGLEINLLLYLVFLGVIISFFFEEELWHKHVCPYGSILNISSRLSRFKMNIDKDRCTGCGLCQKECINNSISEFTNQKRAIDNRECLLCFKCQEVCPAEAISYKKNKS